MAGIDNLDVFILLMGGAHCVASSKCLTLVVATSKKARLDRQLIGGMRDGRMIVRSGGDVKGKAVLVPVLIACLLQ